MNFEQYLDSQIPNWRENVSVEVITELKSIYNNIKTQEQLLENILDMSFKYYKVGIDYSTDYEKTRERLGYYQDLLFQNIENIKKVINGEQITEKNVSK